MKYAQISSTYKDDTIAEAMYSREVEFFHYEFDANNFKFLLEAEPEGAYRDNLQKRLDDTLLQMDNVDRIYNALKAQITDEEAHQAAVLRTEEKRKENDN